ncbi:MAG TPA: DUF202 domain-containing protein [Galbitalea sp.]|jgi:putative membrane protein|nr:DUF202 domain-containing protein [Galbitalea sp.]
MSDGDAQRIFDRGMQPERTALAWRRTALAMGIGSIAALRVFPLAFGPVALVPAGIAVLISVTVFVFAQLRYRHNHRVLIARNESGGPIVLAGGGMVALVAIATFGFAVIAAVLLILALVP